MPASRETPNFKLPLYNGSDHFSVLTDFNGAMGTIDRILGETSEASKSASREATSALTASSTARDAAEAAKASAANILATASKASIDAEAAVNASKGLTRRVEQVESLSGTAKTLAEDASDRATTATSASNAASANANNALTIAGGMNNRLTNMENSVKVATANFEEIKAAASAYLRRMQNQRISYGSGGDKVLSDTDPNIAFTTGIQMNSGDIYVVNIKCYIVQIPSGTDCTFLADFKYDGESEWHSLGYISSAGPFNAPGVTLARAYHFRAEKAGNCVFRLRGVGNGVTVRYQSCEISVG